MTPRTAPYPLGRAGRVTARNAWKRTVHGHGCPAVPPTRRSSDTNIRYQQGTAPLLPALSQVADMRPFRTDRPEGFYGDACVPRQTAVPALDADLHRAAEPSLPNPSHGHQTTTKISDSFTHIASNRTLPKGALHMMTLERSTTGINRTDNTGKAVRLLIDDN